MSADDFAFLVGISRYPNPGFSDLDGPSNDIRLMKRWLTSKNGGDIPDDAGHIVVVETPNPYLQEYVGDRARPAADEFDLEFRQLLRRRMLLGGDRVRGRLYLYFSGHGFCNRSMERDAEAALYSANATREFYEHIFGTQYARVAKGKALFKEIVLIMDCCRDSEVNRRPLPRPYTDSPDDQLAATAQLLAIYAVPKGGKAQERKIQERGDAVHGLLTHALVKALDEAAPTHAGLISSAALRDYIRLTWNNVCGADAPPPPEILLPTTDEIHFRANGNGEELLIDVPDTTPKHALFSLLDGRLTKITEFDVTAERLPDNLVDGGTILSAAIDGRSIRLKVQSGLYAYEVNAPTGQIASGMLRIAGGPGHVQL
jgi:hypothetical protein